MLSDKTLYNKRITTLTEKLEEEVQKLKDDIEQWQKFKVYNYTSPDKKTRSKGSKRQLAYWNRFYGNDSHFFLS